MKIINAEIKDVTVGFDARKSFSVMVGFDSQHGYCFWFFILTNPTDVQRLVKLMEYVGANNFDDLNGKIIRKVEDSAECLRGFGHPIADKFVPILTEEFKEITGQDY